MIEQFYFTRRCGPNSYYHPGLNRSGCNIKEGELYVPQSSKTSLLHMMMFCVTPKTLALVGGGGGAYPSAEGHLAYSTDPINKVGVRFCTTDFLGL